MDSDRYLRFRDLSLWDWLEFLLMFPIAAAILWVVAAVLSLFTGVGHPW